MLKPVTNRFPRTIHLLPWDLVRRNALLPYCGKTLLKGRLEIGKDAYWIKVDPETQTVIYWERYENWSERLKR